MRFVSIDSSLANTGVAVGNIGPTGLITMKNIMLISTTKTTSKQVRASSDTIARCRQTYLFLEQILKEEKPSLVFMETPSGSQSASGMKSYGATCMLIAVLSPPPIEVTPTEVKLAAIGNKTASKREMIDWAYNKHMNLDWFWHGGKLQNKNEHMADAIAIAYAATATDEFVKLKNLLNI
jgi:Holliday junction resolvasome RuvABC endonuclease subunit